MKNIYIIATLLVILTACGKYDNGGKEDLSIYAQPKVEKFYKGNTIERAYYQMKSGSIYKDNGVVKDPIQTLADHGCNMIRINLNVDDIEITSETVGYKIDYESWNNIKEPILKCKNLGIDVMLTFHCSADNGEKIPDSWRAQNLSATDLADTLYNFVFKHLDELAKLNAMPVIVAIGNETNMTMCYDPVYGSDKTAHGVKMMMRGYQAVDAINKKYGEQVKKLLHIASPHNLEWCVSNFDKYGLTGYDVIGMSWYYGFGVHSMGSWGSFSQIAKWCWLKHRKQFMILETSARYTNENADEGLNIGPLEVPGYETSPAGQRKYMEDLCQDVANGGGLGVIYWGGENVSTHVYTFATTKGSSWDNKAFWTSAKGSQEHDTHDGINWMKKEYKAQ